MIQPKESPRFAPPPKPDRSAHRARTATETRRKRARRRRSLVPLRLVGAIAVGALLVLGYEGLFANLNGLAYSLDHANAQRAALIEENARLDDRVAHLASRDRLAGVAAKLGLHDPQTYAVVRVPAPRASAPPHGLALLDWLVPR